MKKLSVLIIIVSLFLLSNGTANAQVEYYGRDLCGYENFRCINVKRGDTWQKLFPNKREREMVKRLNRINIPLSSRSWIVIPDNLDKIDYLDLSPFPLKIKPQDQRVVVVNLKLQAFAAYDSDGSLVHWGPISGGRDWCSDIKKPCKTMTGTFKVIEKQGPECESAVFPIETNGGAPMPYCMYYFRGFALHGSTLPGYHESHGCVRLFPEDAQWLNEQFIEVGTPIMVTRD